MLWSRQDLMYYSVAADLKVQNKTQDKQGWDNTGIADRSVEGGNERGGALV